MSNKFNLSEAAADILNANVASKRAGQMVGVGNSKLNTSVAYGSKDAGVVGDSPEKKDDTLPDYLKGTPTATPPGATPPVGSEKDGVGYTSPKGQPQETQGRSDLRNVSQSDATNYETIRDRKPGKLATQTFQKNAGATFQSYGEETDIGDLTIDQINELMESEELDEGEKSDLRRKLTNRFYGINKGLGQMAKKQGRHDINPEGHTTKGKMSKAVKGMSGDDVRKSISSLKKEDYYNDIDAIIGDENLSEEFKERATLIFEAAVSARVDEVVSSIVEDLSVNFEEEIETVKEEIATKVDDYLNYMVEEWMKENEIAITKGLRSEIVEDFIGGLHSLFKEHWIDIPEEKVDVVEELSTKVEELENDLNEEIKKSVRLNKALNEHKKNEVIYAVCEGLTQTQVEKMKSLADGVEFTTEEEFVDRLEIIKESYFKPDVKFANRSSLDDEVLIEETKKGNRSYSDPEMEYYTRAISQTLTK